jgi:hypothetical protein
MKPGGREQRAAVAAGGGGRLLLLTALTSSTATLLKLSYTKSSLTLAVRHLPGSRLEQMATCSGGGGGDSQQ